MEYILKSLHDSLRLTVVLGMESHTEIQPRTHGLLQVPPILGYEMTIPSDTIDAGTL